MSLAIPFYENNVETNQAQQESALVRLLVSGSRACFRRPEFADDLISYDVITPPAARSILDAVCSECSGRWIIDYIDVMQPVRKNWSSVKTRTGAMRRCHLLVDVAYALTARLRVDNNEGGGIIELQNFKQRVADGAFSKSPFLGLADFPATVTLVPDTSGTVQNPRAIDASGDLGWVLFDTHGGGRNKASFFQASMVAGRVNVGALRDDQLAS